MTCELQAHEKGHRLNTAQTMKPLNQSGIVAASVAQRMRVYLSEKIAIAINFDKSKKTYFRHSPFSKKKTQPFISGCICPEIPNFDLSTPNFAGSSNLNSVQIKGLVFQERKAISLRSGVLGQN